MESNGITGAITVSEDTKRLIESFDKDKFIFTYHKLVEIKSFNTSLSSFIV